MSNRERIRQNLELDFFGTHPSALPGNEANWPSPDRFPVNLHHASVRDIVVPDLRKSKSPLIVIGYASLGELIDFVAECDACENIRIVIRVEQFYTIRHAGPA